MTEIKRIFQHFLFSTLWWVGALLAITSMVLEYAFTSPLATNEQQLFLIGLAILGINFQDIYIGYREDKKKTKQTSAFFWVAFFWGGVSAVVGLFIFLEYQGWLQRWDGFDIYFFHACFLLIFGRILWELSQKPLKFKVIQPAKILAVFSVAIVLLSALLLFAPNSTIGTNYSPNYIHETLANTLFNAASAVTCTGLTTADIGKTYTFLGQVILLVVMQIGGLILPVFSGIAGLMLRKTNSAIGHWPSSLNSAGRELDAETQKSKIKNQKSDVSSDPSLTVGASKDDWREAVPGLIRVIVVITFALELIGAGLLLGLWPEGWSFPHKLWFSVFHAVSAFTNAGFTLLPDSLVAYSTAWQVHWVIAPLAVLGGLGFPVLAGWWGYTQTPKRKEESGIRSQESEAENQKSPDFPLPRYELHSNLVLTVSFLLILIGGGLLFVTESLHGSGVRINRGVIAEDTQARQNSVRLDNLPPRQRMANCLFLAITARSAGFRTVSLAEGDVSPAGRMVLAAQMFIGGSPGGSAGGIKTVILALLIFAVWEVLRGRTTESVSPLLVRSVLTLFTLYLGLVFLVATALLVTEQLSLETVLFEAVSACTNAGFSTGLTAQFSLGGKLVLALAMLIGRVGPLVIFLAILRRETARIEYAGEPLLLE